MKMCILPKLIYRFKTIPIKIHKVVLSIIEKVILKCIYKCKDNLIEKIGVLTVTDKRFITTLQKLGHCGIGTNIVIEQNKKGIKQYFI